MRFAGSAGELLFEPLRGFSHIFDACLASFLAHRVERGVARKLRNRDGQMLVQRVAVFLINFAVLVAMASV